MATIRDTDLLYVQRGETPHNWTGLELKSLVSAAAKDGKLTVGQYLTPNGQQYDGSGNLTINVDGTTTGTANKVVVRTSSGGGAFSGKVTSASTLANDAGTTLVTKDYADSEIAAAGKWEESNGALYPKTLTNDVQVGGTAADPAVLISSTGLYTGTNQIRINRKDAGVNILEGQDNGTTNVTLKKDGSATFAGKVTVDGGTEITAPNSQFASTVISRWTSDYYSAGGTVISFNGDGSATFDGNVGIGTDEPGRKLTVKSSEQYDGIILENNSGIVAELVGLAADNDNAVLALYENGTKEVSISAGTGNNYIQNGNVGIGTDSPIHKLTVRDSGTGQPLQGWMADLGATNGRGLNLYSPAADNASAPFYYDTANGVQWKTLGEQRLTIVKDGNVGIGTDSPAEKLHVNGNIKADNFDIGGITKDSYLRKDVNDSASGELTFNGKVNIRGNIDIADSQNLWFGSSDDVEIYYNGSNNWLYCDFKTSNGLVFKDNGTDKMTLEDSGVFRPNTNNSGTIGASSFYWNNGYFQTFNVSSTLNVRGVIDLADNDILRFGSGDDVEFFTNGSHFYLDLNSGIGNFYIRDGTTTRFTFDDAGHFTSAGNIQCDGHLRLDEMRARSGQQLVLNAGESASEATGQTDEFVYINAERGLEINSSPDNWVSGWAGRKKATICDVNGNSTFPGKVTATSFHGDGSNLTGITAGATLSAASGTQRVVLTSLTSGTMTSAATDSGITFAASSNLLTVAGDINSSSDISLKENITSVGDAVETIKQLEGVKFDWKKNGRTTLGVIAQNVEEVLPELVDVDDEGMKSVKYNGLISVLIEAVKEQQKQIDELKSILSSK